MKALFASAVVENHVEAARHGDDELFEFLVAVSAPLCTARYVIEVINPLDVERHMPRPFDEGKIAAMIGNLRQVNDPAFLKEVALVHGDGLAGLP